MAHFIFESSKYGVLGFSEIKNFNTYEFKQRLILLKTLCEGLNDYISVKSIKGEDINAVEIESFINQKNFPKFYTIDNLIVKYILIASPSICDDIDELFTKNSNVILDVYQDVKLLLDNLSVENCSNIKKALQDEFDPFYISLIIDSTLTKNTKEKLINKK